MKAPLRSPILPGPERALFPLKLLSKALKMKTNMVLICSFFYNIIKTAANSKQRCRAPGSTLGCAGSPVAAAPSAGTAAPMGAACPRVLRLCHRPCSAASRPLASAPMGPAEPGPLGAGPAALSAAWCQHPAGAAAGGRGDGVREQSSGSVAQLSPPSCSVSSAQNFPWAGCWGSRS